MYSSKQESTRSVFLRSFLFRVAGKGQPFGKCRMNVTFAKNMNTSIRSVGNTSGAYANTLTLQTKNVLKVPPHEDYISFLDRLMKTLSVQNARRIKSKRRIADRPPAFQVERNGRTKLIRARQIRHFNTFPPYNVGLGYSKLIRTRRIRLFNI